MSDNPTEFGAPNAPRRGQLLVVVGGSAGCLAPLEALLSALGEDTAVLVVVHRGAVERTDFTADVLGCVPVEHGMPVQRGLRALAPGGYHVHVEGDATLSLSVDAPVHHCRPSLDVAFESAALAWPPQSLVFVVLSGANVDGAHGAKFGADNGATVVVEDPRDAAFPRMPEAAVQSTAGAVTCPAGRWHETFRKLRIAGLAR